MLHREYGNPGVGYYTIQTLKMSDLYIYIYLYLYNKMDFSYGGEHGDYQTLSIKFVTVFTLPISVRTSAHLLLDLVAMLQ